MATLTLRTKAKFRDLIPPLGNEERQQLEDNIRRDGCRDPLVVWDEIIVDGHNRYDICRKHDVKFTTKKIRFADDDEACIWIIQNQFGRRNLAPYTRVELALKLEPLIAAKAKAQQKQHGGTAPGKGKTLPKNSWEVKQQEELDKIWSDPGLSFDAKQRLADQATLKWGEEYRKLEMAASLRIYLAVTKQKIKIGVSSDPKGRVKQLQTSDPDIEYVDSWPGDRTLESRVLEKFSDHSVGGEWFTRSEELLRTLRNYIRREAKRSNETPFQLAKVAGVSHDTIAKGKLIAEHADEETKEKLRTNKVSIHRVAKDIKEKKQKEARKEKRVEAAKAAPKTDSRIIIGDFREHCDKVADGSVSLIFTDPPYDKKAIELFNDLGHFANSKLADGGSLICYVGHVQLIEALNALSTHLRFWWPCACVHSGNTVMMREYGIKAHWKPVLWFVKGTRDDKSRVVSDVMSGGTEKVHHDWQQSQSEAAYWIERLTDKGDLICDPFLGGGTTAAAAQSLGREWIGFEIDEANARISAKRIAG